MSTGRSGSALPVIAARSRLLEELIGVLVGAFSLSVRSLANSGISLPDLKTRASGCGAERCLPQGTCDITCDSCASFRDRSRISAKSNSESSGLVLPAPSNPSLFRVRCGVPVIVFSVPEVWAVLYVRSVRRVWGSWGNLVLPLWQRILADHLTAVAGPRCWPWLNGKFGPYSGFGGYGEIGAPGAPPVLRLWLRIRASHLAAVAEPGY